MLYLVGQLKKKTAIEPWKIIKQPQLRIILDGKLFK